MSHIKTYIEQSLLIPPDIKASLSKEEIHEVIRNDIVDFMETYIPLEQEIMSQVNKELELLNMQIKNYIQNKETELKKQEMNQVELEIAYL